MNKSILVTGAGGFMGTNLSVALRRQGDIEVLEYSHHEDPAKLAELAGRAEIVFHLAGVNRPTDEQEFVTGNANFTNLLCECLEKTGSSVPVVFASSIQAQLENPYGRSKLQAEEAILQYHQRANAPVYIYRFPNVFGKWSRPDYNTVVATFCHRINRGLPVQVSNRENTLRFAYIDDIVKTFLEIAGRSKHDRAKTHYEWETIHAITLGELHDLILSFKENRLRSLLPDLSRPLIKYLYSTYLSFCDMGELAYPVEMKTDDRGWLFELMKSPYGGQIFVSRTKPGITRGNHYHDTKVEKFCVIQGEGIIRFRHVLHSQIIEYPVDDREIRIVDIPPGYTHSIENVGTGDMITLFWANEIFDPQDPDTHFVKVQTS